MSTLHTGPLGFRLGAWARLLALRDIATRVPGQAYRACVSLTFLQLTLLILALAVGTAAALVPATWTWLYDSPPPPLTAVATIVALLTATPIALFLVYVIKKAEASCAAFEESNLRYRESRQQQAKTLRKLRVARDKARAASNAKTCFLANMSHELRTPLNAIIGFSEVMRQEMLGPIGNDAYRSYLDDIKGSGHHLLSLIEDILDISQIESGSFSLNIEDVNLASVIDYALHVTAATAQKDSIKIETYIAANLPAVPGDERRLRQIVVNLVGNAIKFSPTGATITVSAKPADASGVALEVMDEGPGLPEDEDEFASIMEPFGQGQASLANGKGGAGLGLPLVKNLVELHQGNFRFERGCDGGARAIVWLPACEPLDQGLAPDNRGDIEPSLVKQA